MNFPEWLVSKDYEIKESVMNEDGTVKEEGTSVKQIADYYNEFNKMKREELTEAITKDVEGKNTEAIAALKLDLEKSNAEQFVSLNKVLAAQGEAAELQGNMLRKMSDANNASSTETKSDLESVLKEHLEDFKDIKENNTRKEIIMKVAGDMTTIGNVTGQIPVEQREAGVNNIARRKVFIRELVTNGIAVSTTISWVEQRNLDGSAGGTVEGTTKNQIDWDWVVVSETVKKRTAYVKVSTEMLDDIPFVTSEVNNELFTQLNLDVDNQVLNGDNAGQNLNGIIPQSTAWAAGTFALTVNQANLVDVLTVAANQIEVANFMATTHVVHPTDLTTLKLIKATNDVQYVDRLIMIAGQMTLDGVPIVTNTGIAQDTFLTMDGSKDTVFSKGEISLQFGLDGNDLTKNMRTIIAEWRGLNRIKGNDLPAFVTGTISTSIDALETAP